MKAKFGLLSRLSLALIASLHIIISSAFKSCKRDAPINEAEYLGHDVPKSSIGNGTLPQQPNRFPTPSKEAVSLLDYFRNYYYSRLQHSRNKKYVTSFLQEIDRAKLSVQLLGQSEGHQKEDLLLGLDMGSNGSKLNWLQDPSNNTSANKLSLICTRLQQDGSWQVGNLGDIEHLPMQTKRASGGVEKLLFSLTGFLLYIPDQISGQIYDQVLGFKKLKQQWFYYNLNSTGTSELVEVSNQEALRLASELGILFFYDLMANPR